MEKDGINFGIVHTGNETDEEKKNKEELARRLTEMLNSKGINVQKPSIINLSKINER